MHAIAYMQPLGQSVSWIPTVLLPLAPSFGPSVFRVLHYQHTKPSSSQAPNRPWHTPSCAQQSNSQAKAGVLNNLY